MKTPQQLTGPLGEKLFELRGDDLYIAAYSIRQYVESHEMSKEEAYDLAKLSTDIVWMRGMRNGAVMGEKMLEHEELCYQFYSELLEKTPGLVDHMIQSATKYQEDLKEKDPEAWWEQYGRKMIKIR